MSDINRPLVRRFSKRQIGRARRFWKGKGINLNAEQAETMLSSMSELIPLATGKRPTLTLDEVMLVGFRGKKSITLMEARKPEVFDAIRKPTKRKWDPLYDMRAFRGMISVMRGRKDGHLSLVARGGGHHIFRLLTPIDKKVLRDLFKLTPDEEQELKGVRKVRSSP